MLFIEWWLIWRFIAGVLITLLAVFAFWAVEKRRLALQLPIRILSIPVAASGSLFALLTWGVSGCLSYSTPIYSPNHRNVARIRTDDEGATGGNTSVEIISFHGLKNEDVFWGSWRSVEPADIRWVGDSELAITYDGNLYSCSGTHAIKVTCQPKPVQVVH